MSLVLGNLLILLMQFAGIFISYAYFPDPLLLALDLKEEVDEELLSKENGKAEPIKKRKKKVRAPYKTPPRTTCDICQKSVTRVSEHMETHNEQRYKFKCEVCNKDFVTALGLMRHDTCSCTLVRVPLCCFSARLYILHIPSNEILKAIY